MRSFENTFARSNRWCTHPRQSASRYCRWGQLLWVLSALWALSALWGKTAAAQSFPPEATWVPFPCGAEMMNDAFRDENGAFDERDIVGDLVTPAGYSATDESFLYFRIRLDQSPLTDQKLRPFAWGISLSLDPQSTSYGMLIMVNGNLDTVELYQNSSTTQQDDPRDPADQPPLASYPFLTHGLATPAPLSGYGGDEDTFLAFAVPWSDLAPLGLTPATPAVVWAGSSSTANALNGDLACHDGSAGAATLSGSASGLWVLDPVVDSDGDGYPDQLELSEGTLPSDATSHPDGPLPDLPSGRGVDLEGGGGCALNPADVAPGWGWLMWTAILLASWRKPSAIFRSFLGESERVQVTSEAITARRLMQKRPSAHEKMDRERSAARNL